MQNNDLESFILDQEENDFVRLSWNVWPTSKASNQSLIIPLGCLYTPLKKNEAELPSFTYQPVICSNSDCKSVLNYLCRVDINTKSWMCALCGSRNIFPYNINEYQMPPELNPRFSTIDYALPHIYNQMPIIFLYVIDLCMESVELETLKGCIKNSYSKLPSNAYVGIITFGQNVYLHDLHRSSSFSSKFCYSGSTCMTKQGIENTINYVSKLNKIKTPINGTASQANHPNFGSSGGVPQVNSPGSSSSGGGSKINSRFLSEARNLGDQFYEFIDQINIDSWPVPAGSRCLRATGAALSVAISLLQITAANSVGRIMTFIGGPCTYGPGKVVEPELKNVIRSFYDLENDNGPLVKSAYDFYSQLCKNVVNNFTFDLFSGYLDQTGIYEMRNLCTLTGGYLVMFDSFNTAIFKGSFGQIFNKLPQITITNHQKQTQSNESCLSMYFNAMTEIKMSKELSICGAIGLCYGLGQKKSSVSSNEIGIGGTHVWRMASLDSRSTMLFILEYSSSDPPSTPKGIIQFATSYLDCFNRKHLRVTTISRSWSSTQMDYDNNNISIPINKIIAAFDQDASAAIIAKIASFRCFNDDNPKDVLRWVDRILIKLCQTVATFNKGIPESVNLPRGVSQFTQYMFHLRRSQFLQCFNCSPDEASFYRFHLIKEDVTNVCTMIQPILYSYSMETSDFTPKPALLDSTSIRKDNVLILDTFFQVLVHLGQTIAAWKRAGYQNDPKFHSFGRFLQEIERDALDAVASRLPVPRYIYTEFGASQARFLLSKVNPRVTHNNIPSLPFGGGVQNPDSDNVTVFTDDISFDNFVTHLKKLIVDNS